MAHFKITFFKDDKLQVRHGVLIEPEHGNVVTLCYSNQDWIGDFTTRLAGLIRSEYDKGNIQFPSFEELEKECS